MKFYAGYSLFEGNIQQKGGEPCRAIVIKVRDEMGRQDGMVVSVHPDDVSYVLAALRTMSAVSKNMITEAMVNKIAHDGLIVLPTNGIVKG